MAVTKVYCALVQDRYTFRYSALWLDALADMRRVRVVARTYCFEPNEPEYYQLSDIYSDYERKALFFNAVAFLEP